ncbi:MAG: tRNA (adenosine(37)-N6)-threonylcarbamoyltransferase complex dimerization subunit type 1 TsaB [Azospirillaceae bacterium]
MSARPAAAGAGAPVVLGLDTAGPGCGVAVLAHGRTLARDHRVMARGHAEALVGMIDDAVAAAGIAYDDLGLIAVTTGPGAFTGLRIGLATAGGLALATGIGIVGVSTLDAHAAMAAARLAANAEAEPASRPGESPCRLLAVVDSRRAEIFGAFYRLDGLGGVRSEDAPFCRSPEAIAADLPAGPLVLCGDAADVVAASIGARPGLIVLAASAGADPETVARLGAARAAEARPDPPPPVYLRAPDARPAPAARAILP